MTVKLRPAVPDDDAFLLQVYASTRRDEMAAWGWDAAQQDGFLRMQFRAQQGSYAVQFPNMDNDIILYDEKPVGRFVLLRADDEIRLVDLALLPEVRGKGIGTLLLKQVLDESAATDRPCRLRVLQTNPGAIQLYQRLGFVNISEDPIYVEMEWRSA
jgi:ribosomal protein S18 acetylase RimI-like enzyme